MLDAQPMTQESLLAKLKTTETADYIRARALVLSKKYNLKESDAEAVANEAHHKVLRYVEEGKFDLGKRWQPLVETATKNLFLNLLKSKGQRESKYRDIDDPVHQTATDGSSPEENVARYEALTKMRQAVKELPADLQPIVLMTLDGKDTREISDEMKVGIRVVRDKLARGQKMLREILVEQDDLEEAA